MNRGSSSRIPISEWMAVAAIFLSGCSGIGIQASVLGSPAADEDVADAGHTPSAVDSGTYRSDATTGSDQLAAGDAGAVPPPQTGTSPLCQTEVDGGCNPDQWACLGDGSGDSDGGAESCASGTAMCTDRVACRVGADGLVCGAGNFTSNTAPGGVACKQSSDCDIGYECVSGAEPGSGVCKHYCCDSTTCSTTSSGYDSGPPPFCDIEVPISGAPAAGVPVCTSGPACVPLTDSCGAGLACTVVSASGQTACVTLGKGKEHDPCTAQKCGENLACILGTCLQLCNSTNACPVYETCVPPTAFGTDSTIGICTS